MMADEEGSLPHANDATTDAYQIGLNHDSHPLPIVGKGTNNGNGSGSGNGINAKNSTVHKQLQLNRNGSISAADLSPSNPNHIYNLNSIGYPAQQQNSSEVQYHGRSMHIPPGPGYLAPPTSGVYNKTYPKGGSQMPVSWVVNNYKPIMGQALPYVSTASRLPFSTDTPSQIVSSNDNTNQTEINLLKSGPRPGNIRNSETGLNAELHENRRVFDFTKQASRKHSNQSNGNMTNMARGVVNSQEGELPSHNRNNSFTVSTGAPSSTTATLPNTTANANFQYSNSNSITTSMPVYHHQHHPNYQPPQELNRPYYQEFQLSPPNHRPPIVPMNHPHQQHMHHHPPPLQPQPNRHIHQMNNPLIPIFASPPASLENSIKSPIQSHNVMMQPLQPQPQIHIKDQQTHLQEGQQFMQQQHSSPFQVHKYKPNHNVKIIKSPAIQISNLINHDSSVVSPIHSKQNSRSSISSLLSDPIPEKMDTFNSRASEPSKIDKTRIMTDDFHNTGEEPELGIAIKSKNTELNNSIKLNNDFIPRDEALPESKASDVIETPIESVPPLDSIITNSAADNIITDLPVDRTGDTFLSKQVNPISSVATKTGGESESKGIMKIPAKRGRKPKKAKTQVSLVGDKRKGKEIKRGMEREKERAKEMKMKMEAEEEETKSTQADQEKDRQLLKKTNPTSKFITLKVNNNKLKNLLDATTEPMSTSLSPNSGDSELLVLIEEKGSKEGVTINNETNKMTSQQLVQIQQNNRQLVSQFDDIKNALPDLFQLKTNGIPHLPKGYVPLVMAPNGLLIPMEIISVDPNEKKVSIMRPLWEATSGATDAISIADTDSSKDVDYKVKGDGEFAANNPKDFGFDNSDKLASLQLYLFSKEAKMNMTKVEKITGSKRFRKQISYYTRLLEREQLGFIENYKQERNKYQKMLNNLESGEAMTDSEKDLLERKDYEMLREEIAKNYCDEHNYLSYLDHVIELESYQCLDYATRLVKLKNYLNMERVRLERHKNRLCRINTNKSHSIWKRYLKTGGNRSRKANVESNSSCGNNSNSNTNWNVNLNLISQNDFMLLTNPNSRAYGTYVLNNSMDKGNENQSEIIELVEYLLPEKSTLRELYKEMKRLESDNHDRNTKHTSVNSVQKNDMISKYGLKESNCSTGNRLLRELQIDGMNVDFHKNDRVERRGSGQRKARNSVSNWRNGGHHATRNADNGNADSSAAVVNDNGDTHEGENTAESSQGDYSSRHETADMNMLRERSGSKSDEQDSGEVESGGYGSLVSGSNTMTVTGTGTGTRNELNITSCLDPTLRDVDRVKMLNLNSEEIGMSFTKVYGMPRGLRLDEVESDLAYLRSVLQ